MSTQKDAALSSPLFVEFDIQPEGFRCLFLPSVAPQRQHGGVSPASGGTAPAQNGSSGQLIMGGVGSEGNQVFPTSMSYSTWICVHKFSDPRIDPHGIRLLPLARNVMERPDDNLVCFSVVLSARDKALLVRTQETGFPVRKICRIVESNKTFGFFGHTRLT